MRARWAAALVSLLVACGGPPRDACPSDGSGAAGCPSSPPLMVDPCESFDGIYLLEGQPTWSLTQQGCVVTGHVFGHEADSLIKAVAHRQTATGTHEAAYPECPIFWQIEMTKLSETSVHVTIVDGVGGVGCRPPSEFLFVRQPP